MATRRNLSHKWFMSILLLSIVIGLHEIPGAVGHSTTGVCQHYNGICMKRLNSTALRYINSSLGLNETENIARLLLDAVKPIYDKPEKDKRCQETVEKTVCFFVFPFCSAQGAKLDYCREDCQYLFKMCGDDLNKIVGAGKFILRGKLSGIIFHFDKCKDLKSSKDYSEENTTCKHLPFIDLPSSSGSSGDMLEKDVIIMVAVGVPVLLFVIIVCALHRHRMSKAERLHSVHYENGKEETGIKNDRLSNVVSMRDRIREWRVAPSELIELVDICKSRGVLDIPVDNIEYLRDLGSGQYGLVFQGKVNDDIKGESSRIVAVKTLREGSSQDAIKEFCQEVNIMSTFSHPNVVKLIGVSLAGEPYCMIFEFVEFGDLASFLRNCEEVTEESNSAYPKLTVTDQLAMAVQIASGMKYISSIRCVHRDLAARNCLVGRGLVVKISDFGLSRDVYVSEYYRMDKSRMLPVRWLPPEAFVDGKFTTYSDVYSYGVLLWEIFTFAKLPYEDHDNTKAMELILESNLLPKPEGCPDPVYDIMLKCWHINPVQRTLFPEIINELCSLDDFGQRFEAQQDQIHENFKARTLSQNAKMNSDASLSHINKTCNASDEHPINVERLPSQSITKKPNHYAIPSSNKPQETGDKLNYDGLVTLPNADTDKPEKIRCIHQIEAPRAVHPITPPLGSLGTYGDVAESPKVYDEYSNDPQKTYDVPPNHELSDDETYSVPPIPRPGCDEKDTQKTYDVPPISHANQEYPDGQEETYDVPPSRDEPQETYDVPPGSMKRPLIVDGSDRDDDVQQETYDVPPKQEETGDGIYQNSSQVTPTPGHYSVPQSPFLKRRNDDKNNTPPTSRSQRHSYENVDFDGKPLLRS